MSGLSVRLPSVLLAWLALLVPHGVALAQTLPAGIEIIPAAPTSADNIYLRLQRSCGQTQYTPGRPYVSIFQGALGAYISRFTTLPRLCAPDDAPAPPLLINVGRLLPGTYPLTVREGSSNNNEIVYLPTFQGLTLVVTDRRSQSSVPLTRLNYTDHWWDPADSGAGYMVWHGNNDELLLAGFAYGTDGKPTWITLTGGTWVSSTRYEGPLLSTSRPPAALPPGNGFPAIAATSSNVIGTGALDFGGTDGIYSGRFSYRLNGANGDVTRNLRRFGSPAPVTAPTAPLKPELEPAAPVPWRPQYLRIPGTCEVGYLKPAYTVTQANERITVNVRLASPPFPCAPLAPGESHPPLIVELGKLPYGEFVVDVVESNNVGVLTVAKAGYMNIPATVSRRNFDEDTGSVFANYNGHWWDPSDAGAGFMVWQDISDATMVAWFTYDADGKPVWYSLQGGTWTTRSRYEGTLYLTSRPATPGASGVLATGTAATSAIAVGTAILDFTGPDGINTGVFTATLTAGGQVTRNIRRFNQ